MTNKDIVNVYLAYKHKKKTEGKEVNILFLMPFYIMDACYQVFCKEVKDYPCRHQMKQARERFREYYHKYTTDFFRPFNADQMEFITDQMDEFNDYINNSMVILKSKVFGIIPDTYSFEDRKFLSALLLCNVLAQAAQHLYGNMYRKEDMTKEVDMNIEGIKKATHDMARHHPASRGADFSAPDEVMQLINALCKKIMKFLEDGNNEG